MSTILVGIDGTGDISNASYGREMSNSFVAYIIRHSKAKLKRYIRGPGFDGTDMVALVSNGYEFVKLALAANKGAEVLLTGYSRGGAGVIAVAQRLKADGTRVNAMILFDAVDRAIGVDTARIPDNVDRVIHARRDASMMSRLSFGNCGTTWGSPTKCEVRLFRGTHGAIGGAHWKCPPDKKSTDLIVEAWEIASSTKVSYAQDLICAKEVWGWVRPRIQKYGFLENRTSGPGSI